MVRFIFLPNEKEKFAFAAMAWYEFLVAIVA